ncbi:hypothetical protein M9H77_01040 [Catharanthus roseus]|uniref:Uncharacterized protein n=1 Tax=Catharanthus roseus TaxID=4058 RepID=A0ACC0C4W7_CATRO|nr:hypothetical protein M9H77_01040 [Catharanthus roseus]
MNVDMNSVIGTWILEFLLRQPLEESLLNYLIDVLPLPNDNPTIKRMILLRKIEFEISKGCVSESILDCLETIEELDFQNGVEQHSESLKAAYCAVAVACTVQSFANKGDNSKFKYFEAVKRIWRGKVCKMEKVENVGLISEELLSWKDEIEAALWEESVCDDVLKRTEGMDAVGAVGAYVHEEKGKMGPSFLEFVAQKARTDDTLMKLLFDVGNANLGQGGEKKENLAIAADQGLGRSDNRGHKEIVLSKAKHIALKRTRGPRFGISRGSKIADTGNSEVDPSGKHCDLLPTPEVNKVQEDLRSSSLELQAVVKDPLPDALNLAEMLLSFTEKENTSKEIVVLSKVGDDPSFVESSKAVQANEEDLSKHCQDVRTNAAETSLMESNGTVRAFECDDSIDETPDISPSGKGLRLPSPKGVNVSPLKKYEANKLTKRRKKKRWSALEEDALRSAVEK